MAALALALAPVLLFGAFQARVIYTNDLDNRRATLAASVRSSSAVAEARIEAAAGVLGALTEDTVGLQCSQGLRAISERLEGYDNLIRFDAIGRVSCAAASIPADPTRRTADWFERVRQGESPVLIRAPDDMASTPALLALVRSEHDGAFDGAMAAVIRLETLMPGAGPALPDGSELALADASGRVLTQTTTGRFPETFPSLSQRVSRGDAVIRSPDERGDERFFAAAPLADGELYLVASVPAPALLGWTRIAMLSTIAPPLMAFVLALAAVWIATDRLVVRWLQYLQRVAAIYAKGRFTVRSVHAARAPPEIAELARTLDLMADAIVERDESLVRSLQEKDALLREIHHRVKNNLQVISSLVSMQQRALPDSAAREAMQDTRQRISALSLVYRALYQGPDLRRVDLGPFLEELTAQLVMSESVSGNPVDTRIHADHLDIDPDRLAPLALFAVEAITNAQKHAFAGRGGKLTVTFHVEGEHAKLEIADSGGGGEPTLGDGVGRTLMSAFARQLGGHAEFGPNPLGGLSAILTFPTLAQSAA